MASLELVQPALDRSVTVAPSSIKVCTAAGWFSAAAHISAVWPRQPSLAPTSAPWATSSLKTSTLPERAAAINTVSPSGRVVLASAPASSSVLTIGAFPRPHANARGVTA